MLATTRMMERVRVVDTFQAAVDFRLISSFNLIIFGGLVIDSWAPIFARVVRHFFLEGKSHLSHLFPPVFVDEKSTKEKEEVDAD